MAESQLEKAVKGLKILSSL